MNKRSGLYPRVQVEAAGSGVASQARAVVAVGGDCLADIAVLPGEPRVFWPAASDPMVCRTITALAADAPQALAAIRTARAGAPGDGHNLRDRARWRLDRTGPRP